VLGAHLASYAHPASPDGGMADAAASKAVVRKDVRVQVPLRALSDVEGHRRYLHDRLGVATLSWIARKAWTMA
jgi:hypothetical protein